MPFDCKYVSKFALVLIHIGWFFVSPIGGQDYRSFSYGGPGIETINSISLSPDTIMISGTFDQSFSWGDFNLESKGDRDFYIALTDWTGRPFRIITGGSLREDDITNLEKLPNGNMILGGTYWGDGYFLDTLNANLSSSKNGFLNAFTSNGILVWRNYINGSGVDLKNIVVRGQKIYVAGTFESSLSIGDTLISSDYPQNLWVAEFSDQGVFHNVVQLNATKNLTLTKMIALPEGGLILGGQFNDSLIFPKDTLNANTFDNDIFIFSLDDQLEIKWYLKGGGVHRDALIDLVSTTQNQIIAAGDFVGRLSFSEGEELNSGDGIGDAFLVSFNQDGELLWQKNLGGSNFQGIHAIHTTEQSLLVSGSLESQLVIENEIITASSELKRQVFLGYFDFSGSLNKLEVFPNSAQFFPSQIFGNTSNFGITGSFANSLLIGNQLFESPSNYQALVVHLNVSTTPIFNLYKNDLTIHIFPNPANDFLQWDQHLTFKRINLYHPAGIKILSIESPLNPFYLPTLPPGPYFIQLIDQQGIGYTSTFIKN